MMRPMSRPATRMGAASVTAWNIRFLRISAANSGFISASKTLDQGTYDEMPAVHQDEQQYFERERNGQGRHHHHAHAHQHGGDDEINEDERHEEQEAHLE